MAEEVGIVMSLYDRVSPTLKAIAGNTAAFDKNLDDLEESLKAYDKAQDTMTKRSADLKKALAEADQQVKTAQKSYRKLNDEASKRDLDSAIDRQTELRRELQETEASLKANSKAYEDLYNKARKAANGIQDTSDAISKADNRAGSVASGGGMLSALGKAGLISQLGDSIGEASGVFLESALGQPTASAVSSILSGAATGAAAGSMLGAPGIAVGALVGGVAGAISGGSQVYQERDEAFRGYVQDAVEGQLSEMDSIRSSGSVTAGQREQDQIAFAQRLGSDQSARDYLDQVREMATGTNYTYDEITGYSKSLLNTYDPEETFSVLQKLSDATAGLNLDSSGVEMFIAALSRMRTTGKLTQEYMNYFSERGLDADEAIARGLGVDKSRVREMATSGEIGGTEAAQAILDYIQEEFGGLSEKLKSTYDAMVDNLGDAEANLNARMGEGYNETRKVGIEAQMDWLESDRLGEAYEAIGAWKAEIENAKEQYIRDAVNEAMGSEEYETAQAEGDAAEMGRIIMQAKIRGMDEYNANEGKDEVLAQELSLIQGVREDAALNDSYWDAGYTLGQEFSKGRAAGMGLQGQEGVPTGPYTTSQSSLMEDLSHVKPHAAGLVRVPYDGYAALLHRDERVLTAAQAREEDRGNSRPGISITVTGNTFGAGLDEEAVAEAIASAAARKLLAGFDA